MKLNIGGRGISRRAVRRSYCPYMEPELPEMLKRRSSLKMTPSRLLKKKEKGSPDRYSIFGFGGGDGGNGGGGDGSGGGGGGYGHHGDEDPTFDQEGRPMYWLNKALVSTDQSAHQY